MAKITINVSDLTHEPIDEEQPAAQLIVEHHPDYQEPITLDVLPQEVERVFAGQEEQQYVVLRYVPQNGDSRQVVMLLEEFNTLATVSDMQKVLEAAKRNQQQEQRGRGSRRGGRQQRQRIDYASAEHAGEPHRGRITDAEREYVRDHLPEVNERLKAQGIREIDPTDPEMSERYGLRQPLIDDSEAEGEGAIPSR